MPSINGVATFIDDSCNYGEVTTAFFTDEAKNVGTVANATFSNVASNMGKALSAEFYTDSINLSVVNNATFYDNSVNDGDVDSTALFTNASVNSGSAVFATFIGDAVNKGAVDSGVYETPESDQGLTQTVLPVVAFTPTFTNTISGFIVVVLVKDKITSITEPAVTTTSYRVRTNLDGTTIYGDDGEPEYELWEEELQGETYTNDVATTYMYAGSSCIDALFTCKFVDSTDLSAQSSNTNVFSDVFNTIGLRHSFIQQSSAGNTYPFSQYNIMLDDQSGVDFDKYGDFIQDLTTNFCESVCFKSPSTMLGGVTMQDVASLSIEANDGVFSLVEAWSYMPATEVIRTSVRNLLQTANLVTPLPTAPLEGDVVNGVDDKFYRTARLFARSRTDQVGKAYTGEYSSNDELVDGTLDFYYSLGNELFGKLPKRTYNKRVVGNAHLTIPLYGTCSQNAYPPFDNEGLPPTTFKQTWAGEKTWTGSLEVTAISYVLEIDVDSLVYVQSNY